jgi:hypothetical protein
MDLSALDFTADLPRLMVADLQELDAQLDAASALLKKRKDALHSILARRFEDDARKQLVAKGQDTGTATLVANGITVKVVYAKDVAWDQAKLRAAFDRMAPADAAHYAKYKLEVEEKKYTAAPPAVQAALKDARTVKAKKAVFSFKIEDAEAA